MQLDLNNPAELQKAKTRFDYLVEKKKVINLTEKKPKRSLSQNRYEHLLFSWFALEYGETSEYVKEHIFKVIVNLELFKTEYVNEKTGEIRDALRSTADLDTKEKTIAIDRFRDYSSKEAGIYLPTPDDMVFLNHIEKEISNQKQYL